MNSGISGGQDVIVIGGGVVGLSISLELVRNGTRVVNVYPREGDVVGASRAAGAMLGAFGELTADDGPEEIEELEFRLQAQRIYSDWISGLEDLSESRIFQAEGTFIVANNQGVRDRDSINRMMREAIKRGEPAEWVEPGLVPGLDPSPSHAPSLCLFLKNEHAVHSGQLLDAITSGLGRQRGYSWKDRRVVSLDNVGDHWAATLDNGSVIEAPQVVLAGGSQSVQCLSESQLLEAGVPELYFGKGVSCTLSDAPVIPHTLRTPNRAFACGIHVVPRPGKGMLYLGATNFMGFDHEAEKKIQPAELHGLFDETIHQLNTGIRTSRIEDMRVGFRPICTFRRPAVGKTKLKGLCLATGTYRNGVLMAPLVAKVIAHELGVSTSQIRLRNPFSVYDDVVSDDQQGVQDILDIGVRDIVSFLQEPRGALPYNRARELQVYLRTLFSMALNEDAESERLRCEIRQRLLKAPFNETMHMLFYELVNGGKKKDALGELDEL